MEKYLELADKLSDKMLEVVLESQEDLKTLVAELNQVIEPTAMLFALKVNREVVRNTTEKTIATVLKGLVN